MENYFVVGLTNDEVANRGLTKIADALRDDFITTSQAAIQRRIPNPTKKMMDIRFQVQGMMNDFPENYASYSVVLYINQTAKTILDAANVRILVLEETNRLPEDAGNFILMPHFE